MAPVPRLQLTLLGGFQARITGGSIIDIATRKARALLAYLALPPGRRHTREALVSRIHRENAPGEGRSLQVGEHGCADAVGTVGRADQRDAFRMKEILEIADRHAFSRACAHSPRFRAQRQNAALTPEPRR